MKMNTPETESKKMEIRNNLIIFSTQLLQSRGYKPDASDIIKTARMFEEYCVNGYTATLSANMDTMDETLHKKYVK